MFIVRTSIHLLTVLPLLAAGPLLAQGVRVQHFGFAVWGWGCTAFAYGSSVGKGSWVRDAFLLSALGFRNRSRHLRNPNNTMTPTDCTTLVSRQRHRAGVAEAEKRAAPQLSSRDFCALRGFGETGCWPSSEPKGWLWLTHVYGHSVSQSEVTLAWYACAVFTACGPGSTQSGFGKRRIAFQAAAMKRSAHRDMLPLALTESFNFSKSKSRASG